MLRFCLGFPESGLYDDFLESLRILFIIAVTGAPVQACSLAPSKLQTRSTGHIPTPRSSHSMRFPVTAIIKSASFSEIIYIEIQLNEFIFFCSTMFQFFLLYFFVCMDTWNNSRRRAGWSQKTSKRIEKREGGDLLFGWR